MFQENLIFSAWMSEMSNISNHFDKFASGFSRPFPFWKGYKFGPRFGHDHGGFLEIALESNPWRRMACVIGGGLSLGRTKMGRLRYDITHKCFSYPTLYANMMNLLETQVIFRCE